ncbi:PASTA domain-containing protein [Nocardioides plantarum]|uniref:PASTA domain-containing protein n=1 Tax=Nocardioides plantarum TaxID=29299 RepID=A0ABV5KC85_9ACTN|nr:PASTA domain-containing protein [Nocardioides plantarum]
MDDVLDAFDRRLDPLVPTGPAPVTDLVRRGRARRTRRRGLQAGLAAAVAVVAVGTTVAVVQGRDAPPTPTSPAASTPPATPPATSDGTSNGTSDGTRTVGLDGVVVDVPAAWVAIEPCSGIAGALAFAAPGASCFTGPAVQLASTVDDRPSGVAGRQHGLDVRRFDHVCGPAEDCVYDAWTTVSVPELSIGVTVTTPEGDELRDLVAGSVRPTPDGYVAVPDVQGLMIDDAKVVLADAGLDPTDIEPLWTVGPTDPEAGSVVPLGTYVDLPPQR